jgi:hypothetical protein
MISDVLCEAIKDLEYYENLQPSSYQAVAKGVQAVTTVMRTLQRYLDHPPVPDPRLPAYFEKVDALRASVRRLNVTEVETAMKDLMEQVAQQHLAANRRRASKYLYLLGCAMVLRRAVDEIREYMSPGSALQYEWITDEIGIVMTVIKALQLYLDASAQPLSAESECHDKVKGLGESLQRLEVAGLETVMQGLYEYLLTPAELTGQ